jgi:hypothetical protein
MALPAILAKLNDRFFRAAALRQARADLASLGETRWRALRQARLLIETARRVAEPVEALPPGDRPAILLSLYRDAVYWALVCRRADGDETPRDLKTLWAETPVEDLLPAAGDRETLESVKDRLAEPGPASLDVANEDAAQTRAFAEALVTGLDASRRRVDQALGQRWSRIALVAGAVLLLGYGARVLAIGPNLLANKPFRTSSSWAGCAADPPCTSLLFHTDNENNPWVEFDLGAPRTFHRIEVTNRSDCCAERAVPLIAEVSPDRVHWMPLGSRDTDFSTWTIKFPAQTARYLRLRAPRVTTLHLKEVAVR